MKRLFKNQRGFTLLELLVAVSLLAIGLLATAGMQGVALNANSIANRMTFAASLAQQVAEDLMAKPRTFTRLRTDNTWSDYDLDPLAPGNSIMIPSAGTYEASYVTRTNNPVAGVTRIDITITRTDLTASGSIFALSCFKRVE